MPRNVHIKTVSHKIKVVSRNRQQSKHSEIETPSVIIKKTTVFKTKKENRFLKKLKRFSKKIGLSKLALRFKKATKKFVHFSYFGKEREILSATIRHTSLAHKIRVLIKHYVTSLGLIILGILRAIMPVLMPVVGIAIIAVSYWGFNNYSIALQVTMNEEALGYVSSEKEFEEVNARVAESVVTQTGEEYTMESMPVLTFAFVPNEQLSTSVSEDEVYSKMSKTVQEYIEFSYGVFIDGQLIGTLRNEYDFARLQDNLLSYYVSDINSNNWKMTNVMEVVKDTYSKNSLLDYEDMLGLFASPVQSVKYTVKSGDTASSIASEAGINVPVLRMLNKSVNFNALTEGTEIEIGKPAFEINVQTIRQISYNEIIPFETQYINTDTLYENTTQVRVSGSNGSYTIIAEIYEENGVEVERKVVSKNLTRNAVNKQVLVGTKRIAPSGNFIWPVSKNGFQYVSSTFGWRLLRGKSDFHNAVDLACVAGTPIYAADGGTVIDTGYQYGGLGNYVKIDHGNGIVSVYGHASRIADGIYNGAKVYQGQTIAYVGRTGNATGNHLHFGLYHKSNGQYFDPYPYIKGK